MLAAFYQLDVRQSVSWVNTVGMWPRLCWRTQLALLLSELWCELIGWFGIPPSCMILSTMQHDFQYRSRDNWVHGVDKAYCVNRATSCGLVDSL